MAPRARKAYAINGIVKFLKGIQEFQIKEFLDKNSIKMIEQKIDERLITLLVPPAEEYIIPDDIYVWFDSAE